MKLSRVLVPVGVIVLLSACSGSEPVEEASVSPSPVAAESPSPEIEVDPESAKWICEDLRLWDAYRVADLPQEEADMYVLGIDIVLAAAEDDAEPALREIAVEHLDDPDVAAEEMIPWCKENTDPIHEGDPW